jgi:hypothetical protein
MIHFAQITLSNVLLFFHKKPISMKKVITIGLIAAFVWGAFSFTDPLTPFNYSGQDLIDRLE